MGNVYSEDLYRSHSVPTSPAELDVPAGFVLVVRNMTAWNSGAANTAAPELQVYDDDSVVIWALSFPAPRTQTHYFWHGHQAFTTGEKLFAYALGTGWQLRISGYKLSLP